MVQFYEVYLQDRKPLHRELQKFYGIGPYEAQSLCEEVGLGKEICYADLEPSEWSRVTTYLQKHGHFEIHRRKQIREDLNRLKRIECVEICL